MLGRRQIREKVVEYLYAYHQNPIKMDILEKNMFSEIDKIFHLYVCQLNFLVALKERAERQMEIGKNKFLKNEEDINPNRKFIENKALIMLEENKERIAYSDRHKDVRWDLDDEFLVKTFKKITAGKRYADFMKEGDTDFEEDQKFLGKLYLRYVAENENFHDYIEDRELLWTDDLHIANSMVQKTLGFLKEDSVNNGLIRMIKDEEDRSFASKLLRESLAHWEETLQKIEERLQNWELERVSVLDRVILIAAITELDYFPLTPATVIMNEYIEIAKVFSTEKSNIFVNGILDRYIKEKNRS